MKKTVILLLLLEWMASCMPGEDKETQRIDFADIAPQQLRDGSLLLQATASSGLPVLFSCWDPEIAVIEGDRAVFRHAGRVDIIACQPGNEQYYEAPDITRQLVIRDWDPNKKTQEISFELPDEWKISRDGQLLRLKAVASSGLPVSYVLTSEKYGWILSSGIVYFYHAGEGDVPGDSFYNVRVSIIASQAGDDEYNPADNVERTIRVTGDVFH